MRDEITYCQSNEMKYLSKSSIYLITSRTIFEYVIGAKHNI